MLKLRGSRYVSGIHFFDITPAGIVVYPRITVPPEHEVKQARTGAPRSCMGVSGLDEMLGGGLPPRSTTLLQGASGTGKTLLALSFLVQGARKGEPGLFLTLEEAREQLIEVGASRGWPLDQLDQQGLLRIVYFSPVELAADALLQKAKDFIDEVGVRRAAIDSLSSLDLSLGSHGRLRELAYALVKTFRMKGVTTILTHEVLELVGTGQLSGFGFSSIVDNIILLRYVEVEARLTRAVSVLKMRGSGHDHVLREMQITADSIRVKEAFQQFRGVLTGVPTPAESDVGPRRRGPSSRRTTDGG
ncbi:MAG: hypothetical protein HYX94_08395 [Chloroflexi bacterium]|nr:hypothetical protein [Chloroflexota bacterium]